MTRPFSVLVLVALALGPGCRKQDKPVDAPGLKPQVATVEGALHAVACGEVTAVFSGSPSADLPPGSPKSFATESLAFRFGDGASVGFAPKGQLFFSDWSFDVFSPDCAYVALQVDHYGPVHVVKVAQLREYLAGKAAPTEVQAPKQADAPVVGQVQWVSASELDLVASAGGGAEALRARVTPSLEVRRVFFAANAPKGLKRVPTGYEVVP
jgi:hypothetical protein